MLALI
jgi:hypothetical protein